MSAKTVVDYKSLLFDLCDNLRTPFVPRIQLVADHEDPDDDEAFGGEPNNDGLNGYMRMRICDFTRDYVGGSKPAILHLEEDLLTRLPPSATSAGAATTANTDNTKGPHDPASYPQPPQLGVFDDDIDKYHWAVRWHCNEYLVQKVAKGEEGENAVDGGTEPRTSEAEKEPMVTVALTPNGRADAVTRIRHLATDTTNTTSPSSPSAAINEETYFASAAEVKMPFSHFFELLAKAQQNSADNDHVNNMTTEEEAASMGPEADCHRFVDLVARCEAMEEEEEKRGREGGEEKGGGGAKSAITYHNPTNNAIPYIQLQNSSLNTEYGGTLHEDVPSYVKDIGCRLFGAKGGPEAENLWVGSKLSATTMHQDWYENLYWVVRGTKRFTLVPPWEAPYLAKRRCRPVKYAYEVINAKKNKPSAEEVEEKEGAADVGLEYRLCPTIIEDTANVCSGDDGLTEWISTDFTDDPAPIGAREGDTRQQCHPVTASVGSGEVLYLPAMWFHTVEQYEDEEEDAEEARNKGYLDCADEDGEKSEEGSEKGDEAPNKANDGLSDEATKVAKPSSIRIVPDSDEEEAASALHADSNTRAKMMLSPAAAAAPCVIAVNYWFEMQCGGPLFWMQEMLKGMFPQQIQEPKKKK